MTAFAAIDWRRTRIALRFTCACRAISTHSGLDAEVLRCAACGREWEMPKHVQAKAADHETGRYGTSTVL